MDVGNLISGSSALSKSSLNIWKFTVHVLWKPRLENFEHYFSTVWDEGNCMIVWAFFGIAFLWDWNENWPLQVLVVLYYLIDSCLLFVNGGRQSIHTSISSDTNYYLVSFFLILVCWIHFSSLSTLSWTCRTILDLKSTLGIWSYFWLDKNYSSISPWSMMFAIDYNM